MQLTEQLAKLGDLIPPHYVGRRNGSLIFESSPWPFDGALKLPVVVELKLLQLGDTVALGVQPWNTAIVTQIENDYVTFFRPYGHAANFSHTGGVICYTGLEQYASPRGSIHNSVLLLGRVHLE